MNCRSHEWTQPTNRSQVNETNMEWVQTMEREKMPRRYYLFIYLFVFFSPNIFCRIEKSRQTSKMNFVRGKNVCARIRKWPTSERKCCMKNHYACGNACIHSHCSWTCDKNENASITSVTRNNSLLQWLNLRNLNRKNNAKNLCKKFFSLCYRNRIIAAELQREQNSVLPLIAVNFDCIFCYYSTKFDIRLRWNVSFFTLIFFILS